MKYLELKALHEEYRRAVEAARDEEASPEARKAAGDDLIRLRHALDEALIEDQGEREDRDLTEMVEARSRGAKEAAEVAEPPKPVLPIEEIRAYGNSNRRGEVLSFRVVPESYPEKRADWTTVDTTTYSLYYVPETWINSVYMFQVAQSGVLAAGPTILNTANGNEMHYPKLTTDMASIAGAEGTAATETNAVFGTVQLNSYRVDGWTPISDELFRDAGVNVSELVRNLAGRSLAIAAAPYYGDEDIGAGTTVPDSITLTSTLGVTAASTTVVTLDELRELYYSVLPAYRPGASWIANSTVTLSTALAKDDNGQYYWVPSQVASAPDRFMGKPWFEDAYFDTSAASGKVVMFGDIAAAYIVRRIGGIEVSFSRDFAFTSFETTARWAMWHDAATIDTLAAKHLVLHA